jgi:hypothetical protein
MSHKIHKSNAARQQAYRDRLAKKRQQERLSVAHRLGFHVGVTVGGRPQLPVKGCPLCTVTPIQIPVTVGASG